MHSMREDCGRSANHATKESLVGDIHGLRKQSRIVLQTFLPYDNLAENASVLDSVRLRKQVLETAQILDALTHGRGYIHHPVTLSWWRHEEALRLYGKFILDEYRQRGGTKYVDYDAIFGDPDIEATMPPWFGNKDFHAGHRGHLYRKDSVKYESFTPFADAPLLYPCNGSFVERVEEGRFRPSPNQNDGRVYKSIKAAWQAARPV